jgi:hypothetical protein
MTDGLVRYNTTTDASLRVHKYDHPGHIRSGEQCMLNLICPMLCDNNYSAIAPSKKKI